MICPSPGRDDESMSVPMVPLCVSSPPVINGATAGSPVNGALGRLIRARSVDWLARPADDSRPHGRCVHARSVDSTCASSRTT